MSVLRIQLFGGLAISWGDQPLPSIPGLVNRSLFAYLVTYRDRPHTRDLLAGTFWPDLPDDLARRRLSQALWQIGRALSPHAILLADRDTVQLNPDLPLWIDVEQFTKHKAQGTIESAEALEHGAACVEHYTGEFLSGYYDDWAFAEQERLREQFLTALEQLVTGYKHRGEYERALAYARRLASEDPWREEAHGEVMRLCHLLGRHGEALRQFELCRDILDRELEVAPSPELVALAAEIATRAGVKEFPHLPAASRPSPLALLERPDQIPLVGRRAERAELIRHLELAVTGYGGLVLLAGGAGLGKTRLMREVAGDAEWRGISVVWGHSCELAAPLPYQPLVEALRGADLGHLPAIWKQQLGHLLSDLGGTDVQEPAVPEVSELEEERGRLLEALAHAFLALGQAGPHLVILEDLHWMDMASFDALRTLLVHLPASRLLVVGTLRPEEVVGQSTVRQALSALEATRAPQWLELDPLAESETETLIQRTLDLSQPARTFSHRLHTGTEGNPFFVTETLRALVDERLLVRDEGGEWHTPWDDAAGDYAELPVPRSIAQSIERRLTFLSASIRRLLGLAAVVGREVEFDLWLAASEGDEDAVLSAAEELARRGLLVEANEVLGYRFAHDIIRRVVYEKLSPVRRSRLHRQVASVLEGLHPNQVESLARHFHLGQDWPQAIRYTLRAGERAQAVYANQQALDHYQLAEGWLAEGRVAEGRVALGPSSGEAWSEDEITRWRADLAEKQGQIQALVCEYEAADAAYTYSWQAWRRLDDWRGAARVLNRLSFLYFTQDDYLQASHYAEAALAALPEAEGPVLSDAEGPVLSDAEGPTHGEAEGPALSDVEGRMALRATSLTYLGLSAWTQGHYDDALQPLEQALALFEQLGSDSNGLARCLNSLALVHMGRGDLDSAEGYSVRSLMLRQQIGDRRGEAWCWHNQGQMAMMRGDLVAAREKVETARAIFTEIQHPDGLDRCAQTLDEVEQAEEAAVEMRQVLVHLPRADVPTGRPLQDDEYVPVTWTVFTSEDSTIASTAARRRQQILRLLRQAENQEAAPTVDNLAEALQVSRPTIKRDLAALRREGYEVRTRGSRGG